MKIEDSPTKIDAQVITPLADKETLQFQYGYNAV